MVRRERSLLRSGCFRRSRYSVEPADAGSALLTVAAWTGGLILFAAGSVTAAEPADAESLDAESARTVVPSDAIDADSDDEFFRTKIEPLLKSRCYECHSHEAGSASGGLMLDSKSGWTAGGDTGPAAVPGKPDESLLITAVRYDDFVVQMPPEGKLSDDEIALLTEWVRRGAVDPREDRGGGRRNSIDVAAGREFWSYRPVVDALPPAVTQSAWPYTEIDRFVLAKLEAEGFSPAPDASREVLVRRLYFDLTGLPPTPEEIDAFVHNDDPAAYEKLVDRLLASPAFGERWGRHWLDVARFAESVTLRGLIFHEAWRYRDYVIDSFNRDRPFDEFVRQQIAGDLLPAESPVDRTQKVVATTYLMLGNTNLEEQDKTQLRMDVVDEQLDTIGRGLLAQTVTCARCHDHKFDPIPTRDYYALAGILRNCDTVDDSNVSKWTEVPLPAPAEIEHLVAEHQQAIAELEDRLKTARALEPKLKNGRPVARGVLPIDLAPGIVVDDVDAQKVGEWKDSTFSGTYFGIGYTHDLNTGKGEKTITFQPELPASGRYEVWLAYDGRAGRASSVPVLVFSAEGERSLTVDMGTPPPLGGRFTSLGTYRFEKDGQSYVRLSNDNTSGHLTPDLVAFIPEAEVAKAEETFSLAGSETPDGRESVATLETRLKKLKANAPDRPMAMSAREDSTPTDVRVHVRGSVHSLGDVVPRGFLQVATVGPMPEVPDDQSGRVELADWIVSGENPLTARVFVNRTWHWLFGSGIVRTVDNFGTTGETPSHPALLDHLAARFVQERWSTKTLIRRIVLSRTYRQSANGDPQALKADPENRLFGRANRRRLDAEAIRDAILVVSDTLTARDGGKSFPDSLNSDYGFSTQETCRSVYLPVFRNALPVSLEAFDFANPSTVVGRRTTSTIPQQALFLLNSPFVVEQSRAAARTLAAADLPMPVAVARAYRATLGRSPTEREQQTVTAFLTDETESDETGSDDDDWARVFQALFASPEFRFVE